LLAQAYALYQKQDALAIALQEDVAVRFSGITKQTPYYPEVVSSAVVSFIDQVAQSRNLARF
jgi:hypothetical protein